jgi:acetyltransferase-like isoleucine patch superfamily enzyme
VEKVRTTLTREELQSAISTAVRHPHGKVHKGRLIISPEAFQTPGKETNVLISRFSLIDCTGSIHIGPWCNITARSRIYTHDHIHRGTRPLLDIEEEFGVLWQDKYIGADVTIHDGAIVLYQVTVIPDGFVLGAGSVLTKNPGPYEIWAGVPARKIGVREKTDVVSERDNFYKDRFDLETYLAAQRKN